MPAVHADGAGTAHSLLAAEILADAAVSSGHEGHQSEFHHVGHSTADTASAGADCCQSDECECPCLHVPCVALDALVLSPVATALLRTSQGLERFPSQRPSGLFRPPARFS
ncbi:CopL family metal-binding regulatory protein [Steroidobacter sp.]|uniref:CopL family metal-binding regulatory protein n=1 Tax=Steroidobacter sp. TaxID=1978227 RepID=UPI0039C9282E